LGALLVIHGSLVADGCVPLLDQPALRDRVRPIVYHRRGYDGVACSDFGIEAQAEDAVLALRASGLPRAHVLGHSSGASIALQLAVAHPGAVRSLILVEPAIVGAVAAAGEVAAALSGILPRYAEGRHAEAVEALLSYCNPGGYREALEGRLAPGWFERAVASSAVYFEGELPALAAWSVTRDAAARITVPTLLVCGADSPPVFHQTQALLAAWLPCARTVTIPGAGHQVPTAAPEALAEAIVSFLT